MGASLLALSKSIYYCLVKSKGSKYLINHLWLFIYLEADLSYLTFPDLCLRQQLTLFYRLIRKWLFYIYWNSRADVFITWIFRSFRKMFLFRLVGSAVLLPGMFWRKCCRNCILPVGGKYSQVCCKNWYWMRRGWKCKCHVLLRMQGHMRREKTRNLLFLNCISLSEAV